MKEPEAARVPHRRHRGELPLGAVELDELGNIDVARTVAIVEKKTVLAIMNNLRDTAETCRDNRPGNGQLLNMLCTTIPHTTRE